MSKLEERNLRAAAIRYQNDSPSKVSLKDAIAAVIESRKIK